MEVIGRQKIENFKAKHSGARKALDGSLSKVKYAQWRKFADIKETFNSVDKISKNEFCFNIGGNNHRIIARISFEAQSIRIKKVMTHSEYDKWNKNK